jgi:hypothetical protein
MKKYIATVNLLSIFFLAACGGGGGDNNPEDGNDDNNNLGASFSITTKVAQGGVVSPASVTLQANETANFTVAPNSGYSINTVSGCNGSLSGNIYTVATINADCEVVADFVLTTTGGGTNVSNRRIARVIADYDNNGQQDAIRELSYDGDGRLLSDIYTYLGDGTTDRLNLDERDALQVSTIFDYDANGRLILWDRAITFINLGSVSAGRVARVVMENSYNADGTVNQYKSTAYNISGQLLPFQPLIFEANYNGNQLINFTNSSSVFGTTMTTTTTFNYGANGLPDSAEANTPAVTVSVAGQTITMPAYSLFHDFEWDAELRNTRYLFSYPLDVTQPTIINGFIDVKSSFDSMGLLTNQDYTSDSQADKSLWSLDSRLTFAYDPLDNKPLIVSWDLNRNGSIDATLTYEWEMGTCATSYFWTPVSLAPNRYHGYSLANVPHPSFVPGTGFNRLENCIN